MGDEGRWCEQEQEQEQRFIVVEPSGLIDTITQNFQQVDMVIQTRGAFINTHIMAIYIHWYIGRCVFAPDAVMFCVCSIDVICPHVSSSAVIRRVFFVFDV